MMDYRRHTAVELDWRAAGLVALFAFVIGVSLLARPVAVSDGVQSATAGASTGEQTAIGGIWVIAEVVFAVLLLGLIFLWSRLPEWLREISREVLSVVFWVGVGALIVQRPDFPMVFAGIVVLFTVLKVTDELDLWWTINNLLALAIAIWVATVAGITLGPIVMAVGLLGLSIYDNVFADRSKLMFDLASWTVGRKLPVLFIVPTSLRLSWDQLAEATNSGELGEELIGFGIGMADLLLPAAFVVSLAHTGELLLVTGAVAGTFLACPRMSWKMSNGGGAGMPPLTVGAVGGAAIASIGVIA